MAVSQAARVAPPKSIAIASPISTLAEVDSLAAMGASEFYCGVSLQSWASRYGDAAWLNRRGAGAANPGPEELGKIAQKAADMGIPVAVPLNAPYYTAEQLPVLLDLCAALEESGVSSVIVSDPGLMLALRASGSALKITASSVAAIRNRRSAAFYRDLGLQRLILPRHLTVADIVRIRKAVGDIELEVFGLNDGCVYEEGFCATTHAAGAFCLTEWDYALQRLDGRALSEQERQAFDANVQDYRSWIWHLANCGYRMSARQLPNGPCGLCAVWDFCQAGIDCLKIVGREAHPSRKLRSLQLLRTVVELVDQGASRDEVRDYARELRDTPELCGSGYMCYYRDAGLAAG